MLLFPFGNLSHTSILYYYYDLYVILFQNYSNRGINDNEVHLVVRFCLPFFLRGNQRYDSNNLVISA